MKAKKAISKSGKATKIIRIGGTSYSGSTMLDLMLSNADDAFSCGEVYSLFHPSRPQHINPECACSNPDCNIWDKVKANGERNLWDTLSRLLPKVRVFVDSSKKIGWFASQRALCDENNFSHFDVLIWKTPAEFAYSRMKRGEWKNWRNSYVDYHTNYFHTTDRWVSVRYADIAREPTHKLKKLCNFLEIPFFIGKELYWNKEHHTLFGSSTAKLNLYEIGSPQFINIVQNREAHKSMVETNIERAIQKHRKIFREQDLMDRLPAKTIRQIEEDSILTQIQRVLEKTEVDSCGVTEEIHTLVRGLKPMHRNGLVAKISRYIHLLRCKPIKAS